MMLLEINSPLRNMALKLFDVVTIHRDETVISINGYCFMFGSKEEAKEAYDKYVAIWKKHIGECAKLGETNESDTLQTNSTRSTSRDVPTT